MSCICTDAQQQQVPCGIVTGVAGSVHKRVAYAQRGCSRCRVATLTQAVRRIVGDAAVMLLRRPSAGQAAAGEVPEVTAPQGSGGWPLLTQFMADTGVTGLQAGAASEPHKRSTLVHRKLFDDAEVAAMQTAAT